MRVLHTSDWHLGQKFLSQQNREAEEHAALAWLLDLIRDEAVDALIVAGDIFDVNNPPINAERQYYNFLNQLKTTTGCRHVVIIGGNHDSPLKLNAPRELLRAFDIHVVGSAAPSDALSTEIIELKNPDGSIGALVAAVPFLRERDVALSVPGESVEERIARVREGIRQHFENVAALIQPTDNSGQQPPPVIATGHLFATGSSASEEQRNIYLGSQDHIRADQFPALFDYVALGHIHRGQKVGGQERVRYSGSLIPLSFSEAADCKMVLIVEVQAGQGLVSVQEIPAPTPRRLLHLTGTVTDVEAQLQAAHQPGEPLPAWAKVVLVGDDQPADAKQRLHEVARDLHIDILSVEIARRRSTLDEMDILTESLADMTAQEVFLRRCQSEGLSDEATEWLRGAFSELQEWMAQNPEKVK